MGRRERVAVRGSGYPRGAPGGIREGRRVSEQQQLLPCIPPVERTVVEGNIVEHPCWKLTNRQAKPLRNMIDKATGKVLVDPATGKPQQYPDPADYTVEIDLGPVPTDVRKRRQLKITASVHHGYPTVFAFRVLVVVVEKAHLLNYLSQKVEITPTEIVNGLGIEKRGGSTYRAIYDALNALESVELCYTDTYYDATSKRVTPGRRTERLVKKSVFKATREDDSPPPSSLALPGMDALAAPPVSGSPSTSTSEGTSDPENYVELGDGLWLSLTAGYRFPVDREYLNDLPNELTQRLYSYLTKKDSRSAQYEENVISLGRRLGLSKSAPSDIRDSLEPALVILETPRGAHGKVFLRSYRFVGQRSAMKLVVVTNREADVAEQQAAAEKRAADLRTLRERLGAGRP
jgi:hypothetical protein